ncbi:MAG TPA: hypothetical protein VFE47_14035 [Tepidisphaeraceae bacterium]|jgi:Spy/CpxP family protein refolding chaperone|nr:hypothetical protein [Tepidisphaeraceae bacterium]
MNTATVASKVRLDPKKALHASPAFKAASVCRYFIVAAFAFLCAGALSTVAAADAPTPPPAPKGVSNPGDYCTVFLALKVQPALGITADQATKLADLKTKLDEDLKHVGDAQPGEQPPTSRTVGRKARAVVQDYGKQTKALLTADQDAKLQDLFKNQSLKTIVIHTNTSRHRVNGKTTEYSFNVELEYTHYGEEKADAPADKK